MKSLLAMLLTALCACALSAAAWAGPAKHEASMLLTGHLSVSPQGAVQAYTIDKADKVPPPVMALLAKAIPRWRFYPVVRDGHAVIARSNMSVRVVAVPVDDGHYQLRVAGTHFGNDRGKDSDTLQISRSAVPHYPRQAILERVAGTAYVVARIDRQGRVTDVAATQVNLRVRGPSRSMQRWRQLLARSAETWVRTMHYAVPTTGPLAHDDHWVFRTSVTYSIDGLMDRPAYGQWVGYVPGPRADVPWLNAEKRGALGGDALPDGTVALLGAGLKRITPPDS